MSSKIFPKVQYKNKQTHKEACSLFDQYKFTNVCFLDLKFVPCSSRRLCDIYQIVDTLVQTANEILSKTAAGLHNTSITAE